MKVTGRLRFAVLLDREALEAWQALALDLLVDGGSADPVLIVVNDRPTTRPRPRRWRQAGPQGTGLWQLYERTIARRSRATQPVAIPPSLSSVAMLRVTTPPPAGQSFSVDDLAAIREARPDFIIRFGFGILKGDILAVAPHGVWSYHHGDPADVRGQPPGFWEIALGLRTTGVVLQRLNATLDAGTVLHRGRFRTVAHSYAQQRDQLYFGAASWLRRTCAAIALGGDPATPASELGPVRRKPTNLEFIRFAVRTARAAVSIHWQSLFVHQQWTVGSIRRPVRDAVDLLVGADNASVDWMPERLSEFYADPFVLAHRDGRRATIIAERLRWKDGRGDLATVAVGAKNWEEPHPVWSPPFHCSYPFLFRDGEAVWCVPEIAGSGTARAFAADEHGVAFTHPAAWSLPVGVVDPTIVRHEGRFWLFAADPIRTDDQLNLFYADRPDGTWTPHPLNPVKTDIGGARPAGKPFTGADGKLIRPAQDCIAHYGAAIALQEVMVLTPESYEEKPWGRIDPIPGRYDHGIHTLGWDGDWTVVDGARRTFVAAQFWRTFKRKFLRQRGR